MAIALLTGLLLSTGAATAQHAPFETERQNFDLRTSDDKVAVRALTRLRRERGVTRSHHALHSDQLTTALAELSFRFPALSVEHSVETGAPEVIGTRGFTRLSPPSDAPAETIARRFVEANATVYGLSPAQAARLETDADYTNPAGNISWVRFRQRIHDLPVFRGELTVAMTKDREIFRTMGQLAVAVPEELAPPTPKLGPADAIAAAASALGMNVDASELIAREQDKSGFSATFERGPFAWETRIELVWFPLGPGALEPAWSMTLWGEIDAYYMLVSANDGLLLFSKNITDDQTQSATYNVYRNSTAYIDVADNPAPLTPGPINPNSGTQGALLSRENVTLIGNEGPLFFNTNGWITDDANGTDGHTDGNNVEAGLDVDGTDGVDAPVAGAGRVFSSAWNPAPGNPGPGHDPTTATSRQGAVIQMFYIVNRWHDVMYQLGFTEQSLNFQDENFGNGGAGGDRIRAEGQDSSGTNNANMSTPADGGRGRMQMFRFTGPTPDRDGTADAEIVIHELTHGLSNRLHGNASGLGTNMARGMGEGWSDFYAHTLLAEPSDPLGGIYTTGGYSTLEITSGYDSNYYYGIRRFPKAIMSSTGGPGNLPHNPLTFADLNAGCDLTDGAFPRGPIGSSTCDQVHAAGEIWSSALWEVRALMISRLGFSAGTQHVLQLVTDGMKLSPLNPTFLQARDAIIAAASLYSPADVVDVWEGFRIRGMGFSAEVLSTSPANVIEAFDLPNVRLAEPITFQSLSCDNPALTPVPGDTVAISVPVENVTGSTINNVVVTLEGSTSVPYGNITDGAAMTRDLLYTVPDTAACGQELSLQVQVSSDIGPQAPATYDLLVGLAPTAITEFSNFGAIDVPAGQPGTTSGPAFPYPSTVSVSGITDPVAGATITLHNLNHTWVGDVDVLLEGPGGETFVVMSDAFSSNNRTGTVVTTLEIRDDAAETMPTSGVPPVAGTFKPTNSSATDAWDLPAPAGPYNHPAPGGSATFASVFGGTTVNGTWSLWIDDDAGGDPGTLDGGWTLGIITAQAAECPACSSPYCVPVVDVSNRSVNTTLAVDACFDLTADGFSVLNPDGDVTFRAGHSISLGNGFEVEAGTGFRASIDPALAPPP